MKRRAIAAGGILLLWLAGLGLLVRREYFRPNLERFAEAAMRVAPGATYYSVERDGRHVGFASSTIDTSRTSVSMLDYLVVDAGAEGGADRFTTRTSVLMSRGMRVRSFELLRKGNGDSLLARGRVLGDTLLEIAVVEGKRPARTRRVPLQGPVLMPTMVPLAIALGEKPKVGRHYTLPVFDPATFAARDVDFAVTAESLFVVNDSSVFDSTSGRWRGVLPDTLHAWQVTADGHLFSGWIDEDGRVLQTKELGLQLRRRPYEVAFENWRIAGRGKRDEGRDGDEGRGTSRGVTSLKGTARHGWARDPDRSDASLVPRPSSPTSSRFPRPASPESSGS